jgi:hypothetical protein
MPVESVVADFAARPPDMAEMESLLLALIVAGLSSIDQGAAG